MLQVRLGEREKKKRRKRPHAASGPTDHKVDEMTRRSILLEKKNTER